MRVYFRNTEECYDYPCQMEKILGYLSKHGTLIVPGTVVEKLYRDFSDECFAAGWMDITEEILESFADWLASIEL